jgi:hypothetical protein
MMDVALRLILRFILVPLGYFAAVLAGAAVILFGSWRFGEMALQMDPDTAGFALFGFAIAGPILFVMLLSMMWLPGAIGILLSEAFAIRSWLFHALNGAVSAWIGWQLFGWFDETRVPLNQPLQVIAAGIAGGFAYWLVAGSSAGFWKPVFRETAPVPRS